MEKCPLYVKSSEEQACGSDQNPYKNVSHAKNWVKELNCFGRKEDRGAICSSSTYMNRNQSNFVFSNYFFLILGEWGGCSEQGPGDSAVLRPRGRHQASVGQTTPPGKYRDSQVHDDFLTLV